MSASGVTPLLLKMSMIFYPVISESFIGKAPGTDSMRVAPPIASQKRNPVV